MTRRLSILCALTLLFTRAVAAQTITLAPSDPKRWDGAVSVGWLAGNKEEVADRWDTWYDTFATSLDVGRYWTPHLKTELGAIVTTRGRVNAQEPFTVPGQPNPMFVSREHRYGLRALNLSAAYQAFENTWVHPFVAGGVHLGWERHRVDTPFPYAVGHDSRARFPVPPARETPGTRFDAKPFLSAGAKFYVSELGFVRTDVSAAFDGRGATRVWWRIGGGVDF